MTSKTTLNMFDGITYKLIYDDKSFTELILCPDGMWGKYKYKTGCEFPAWMRPSMDEL